MAAHNDIFHFIGRPRTKHATINVQEPKCIISLHDQRINYTVFLILIYPTIFFYMCDLCPTLFWVFGYGRHGNKLSYEIISYKKSYKLLF